MCNQYTTRPSAAEVASFFDVAAADIASFNVPATVYPRYPGMVVRNVEGRHTLGSMAWGFPRIMKSKKTGLPLKPKPVNNARDDKLLTSFWRSAFEQRRCMIPVSAWAEAEGEEGRKTRTWYSLPDTELFAVAGLWRPTDEWGDAYTMVMVDGCTQMSDVHDRMPVILQRDQWDIWTQSTPSDALSLVKTYNLQLAVQRTEEAWYKRKGATSIDATQTKSVAS